MAKQKNAFPPVNREDLRARGIDQLDFVFITGDAYIDHPSFGAAIITRLLESRGYTVGIIAQPDWHGVEPFRVLGKPKLGFLISSGNIDSMVNHYSVSGSHRTTDVYTEEGVAGKAARPRDDCLRQPLQTGILQCTDDHRRHRGEPSPLCAL